MSVVADNTTSIDGKLTAVEAKYVDEWGASLRNPSSEIGGEPWAVDEQQMVQQAKAYSQYFPGGMIYHTNSVGLAAYYTNIFRKTGVRSFRFVITPATKMRKKMPIHPMERIFGVGAFERKVPGTGPGEEASVRYVSFDDPAFIPELFHEVLNKIQPLLMKTGGQSSKARNWSSPTAAIFLRYCLALTSKDGANKLSSAPKRSAERPRKC